METHQQASRCGTLGLARVSCLLVVTLVLSGCADNRVQDNVTTDALPLVIDQATTHFGTVWTQENFAWEVLLHNATDEEWFVMGTVSAQPRVRAPELPVAVPPRGTAYYELHLDLTGDNSARFIPFEMEIELLAEPAKGGAAKSQQFTIPLKLRGKIQNAFLLEPARVTFDGAEALGPGKSSEAEVRVKCFKTVSQLLVDTSGMMGCNATVTRLDEETFTVQLQFNPRQMGQGPFDFSIGVAAVFPNGETTPQSPIKVNGAVVAVDAATND